MTPPRRQSQTRNIRVNIDSDHARAGGAVSFPPVATEAEKATNLRIHFDFARGRPGGDRLPSLRLLEREGAAGARFRKLFVKPQ